MLEDKLSKVLEKLDLFQMPERNARIVELYLGLDGHGTKTFDKVLSIINEEFKSSSPIGRERVRTIGKQGIEALRKKLVWDSEFERLYNFVLDQSPIEYELLSHRFCDVDYNSFSFEKSQYKPFTRKPFDTTGVLELLKFRPDTYKGIKKKNIKTKRIMYSYQRKKSGSEGVPTPRNSIPACRFVIPEDF